MSSTVVPRARAEPLVGRRQVHDDGDLAALHAVVVAGDLGHSLANAGLWVCDYAGTAQDCASGTSMFGPIPAVVIGTTLLLAVIVAVLVVAARRPDRLTLLVGLTILALAFYVVPTRVHERYAYPVFALAVVLAAIAWRWRVAYLVLTVTIFLNMYVALTNPFYANPGIKDWLGIGNLVRSEPIIAVIALVNGVAFVWTLAQLRPRARDRLEDELAEASTDDGDGATYRPSPSPGVAVGSGAAVALDAGSAPQGAGGPSSPAGPPAFEPASGPAPAAIAVATMPTWTRRPTFEELGIVGWFKARLGEMPLRPDRSASLRSEGGGRLDKLDLFLVVMLVIGTMLLRTFRLAEPYQMHFDEVYHARTATEFLQYWRYGLSHDIYEWTHPHLAKYAMAGGLVLWGEDHVSATSDLETPVRAVAVEPRRVDELAPDQHAGERLHVATGTEIRTYDLRTRQLISTIPAAGAAALAIDATGNQLVIGYDDGRIATLDLTSIAIGGAGVGPADHRAAGDRRPPRRPPARDRRRGIRGRRLGRPAVDRRSQRRDGSRLDRPRRDRRSRTRRQRLGALGERRRRGRSERGRIDHRRHPLDRCGRLRVAAGRGLARHDRRPG